MARGIKGLHPLVLIIYITIILIGLMVFRDIGFLVVGLGALIINLFVIEEEETLKQSAKGLIIMSLVIIILNPIFNHRGETILFYFYGQQITLEAVIIGVQNALSLSAILILFMLLNKILSMDGLLFLLTKLSKRWAMLIMISLNFVPSLRNKVQNMQEVQATKRVVAEGEHPISAAKTAIVFIEALLNQSLEDAMIAADSMTARGYGSTGRSHYHNYSFYLLDWLVLMGIIVGFIFMLLAYQSTIIWALICLTPTLVEGSERLKWLFYQ